MNKSDLGYANGGLSLVYSTNRNSGKSRKPDNRAIERVSFNRDELATLLNVYGRSVSSGAWCDYAMDFLSDRALFSIYRSSSENPLFVVEKNPKLHRKQGQYLVRSQQGKVLKRGRDLSQVLRVLDSGFMVV